MQFLVNTFVDASIYLQVALSFGIIFYATRFFNLAHGGVILAGSYSALFVLRQFAPSFGALGVLGVPVWAYVLAGSVALIAASAVGGLTDRFVYRPLRLRRASSLMMLLASFGVLVVLQNVVDLLFGGQSQSLRAGRVQEGYRVFSGMVTGIQLLNITAGIVLAIGAACLLQYTRLGKEMLATADNQRLAKLIGIDTEQTAFWAMLLGSGLAGLSGMTICLETNVSPPMGFSLLLKGVIAVIVGGIGSPWGAIAGSFALAFAENAALLAVPASYRDAVAFSVLIAFLAIRPNGLLNMRLEREE